MSTASKEATMSVTGTQSGITRPQNGSEYLESLRDDRAVYIYGERVKDVTTHPAFRNTRAWWRGSTTPCTIPSAPTRSWCRPTPATAARPTPSSRRRRRSTICSPAANAIAEWAQDHLWLARPLARLQGLVPGDARRQRRVLRSLPDNARRWYKFSQERVPFINHAIIHPPVDRDRPPNEVGDICCHVEKETDAGHRRFRRQGGGDRLGADQLHLRRPSRPHSAAGQEVRRGVHGADQCIPA